MNFRLFSNMIFLVIAINIGEDRFKDFLQANIRHGNYKGMLINTHKKYMKMPYDEDKYPPNRYRHPLMDYDFG
ncbi:hypothetical protein A3Q56_00145 [Intoshia linei]|uniref:Uncharacterized protein n=1 Tax=Intoshia linei TaxID=1819745 RepID=A0A177BET7_9BILA|nr:hypothetical protein A3Q56_00145 [Intoshia linei]